MRLRIIDLRKIWHVKRGERNGRTENCPSSRKRMSFFCAMKRADILPIFFYSLDFFFSHFFCVKTKEVTYTLCIQRKWQIYISSAYLCTIS